MDRTAHGAHLWRTLGLLVASGLLVFIAPLAAEEQRFEPVLQAAIPDRASDIPMSGSGGKTPAAAAARVELAAPPVRQNSASEMAAQANLPDTFLPWWNQEMSRQLKEASEPLDMSLDSAVVGTLMHSPQVRVLTDIPIIRSTSIMEAQGKFDLHTFAETKFVNTSDPVGSKLTTGGANRFLDQNVYASAGVRQQTMTGAQVEMSQKIGYQQNNSIYFFPNDQGTARLTLTMTQPLLNGRGRAYNSSMMLLARIDTSIARDELSKDLQALLLELHQTYWDLYQQRAVLLQKRRLYDSAVGIRGQLQGRKDVDVVRSQLVRAEAAVANREAATIRYRSQVRNAEARLRALVNDPALLQDRIELVPSQVPTHAFVAIDLQQSLVSALQGRPEVTQAAKEVRAASIRVDMSKNELLPILNMVLGTYVYGLVGQGNIPEAYGNQFSVGRPTYSAGFTFDVPYNNWAAKARLTQHKVEVRQLCNQLQATMNKIRAEVEIAVREVETTYREMLSKYRAMAAGQAEIDYLTERWQLLPGDQQVAGVMLDDLLNAQERLADTEAGFVQAVVAYNVALVNLRKVTGTLLDAEDIRELQGNAGGLPMATMSKQMPVGGANLPADQAAGGAPGQPAASPATTAIPAAAPAPAADAPEVQLFAPQAVGPDAQTGLAAPLFDSGAPRYAPPENASATGPIIPQPATAPSFPLGPTATYLERLPATR